MKKIALLIHGQYREFEIAVKHWKLFELPHIYDIYFATWDNTYENAGTHFDPRRSFTEDVSITRIENAISLLDKDKVTLKEFNICTEIPGHRIRRMIDRMKTSLQMLRVSNEKYDTVIMLRPDIWLSDKLKWDDVFYTAVEDGVVWTFGDLHKDADGNNVIMDCMFAGNTNTMLRFLNLPHLHNGGPPYDLNLFSPHRLLGNFFVKENLQTKCFPGGGEFAIVRSNCRGIENLDFNIVTAKAKEWWIDHYGKI